MLTIRQRMKPYVWAAILAIALSGWPMFGQTAASASPEPIQVFVDADEIAFQIEPVTVDGTTLVQFRPLFAAMGMEVSWEASQGLVTGTKEGLAIELRLNAKTANVNDRQLALSQAPRAIDGHTMVPLRFIGEATGAIVHWDAYHRQITIFTETFLTELGVTKEEMLQFLAEVTAEQERQAAEQEKPPVSEKPKDDEPDAELIVKPVDPKVLKGMYYGLRNDFGGYECGGMCWDIYTFLDGNRIYVGPPPEGGSETVACQRDGCLTYTIKDGMLALSNGDSYAIGMSDSGELVVNDVALRPVAPVKDGLRLDDTYTHLSYTGLVGIDLFASSSRSSIAFSKDGTFEADSSSLASLGIQGGPNTTHTGVSGNSGTYTISGNTITLTFEDGTVKRQLIIIDDSDDPGSLDDILLGDRLYYADDDE